MSVHPFVACSRKTRYESRDQARLAMRDLQRNPVRLLANWLVTGKMPRRIYHCHYCDGWHLTSQPVRGEAA